MSLSFCQTTWLPWYSKVWINRLCLFSFRGSSFIPIQWAFYKIQSPQLLPKSHWLNRSLKCEPLVPSCPSIFHRPDCTQQGQAIFLPTGSHLKSVINMQGFLHHPNQQSSRWSPTDGCPWDQKHISKEQASGIRAQVGGNLADEIEQSIPCLLKVRP